MTLVVTLGSKVTAKSLVIVYIGDCWQRWKQTIGMQHSALAARQWHWVAIG